MFKPIPSGADFPAQEEAILKFWKEHGIYEKSLEQRAGAKKFVFYEGPPTANGMPHPGHCLTRAIKDLFPRYRTMRGELCERKGGWDTHGLPVEVEVCKELGIHSKEEIENFGVEPFIHKCQESVWRYMKEWERLTERLGFWIHLDEAYVTYHQSYVESVWWSLKNLFDRGLLYQGHKIVWWWAQGGTALSSGEVGQGYREVADPSVYVECPLLDDKGEFTRTSLLVWTTTPWTLPSNQFVAVNPDVDYALVCESGSETSLVMAYDLVETIAKKAGRDLIIERTFKGVELRDRRYCPPFDYFKEFHDRKAIIAEVDWSRTVEGSHPSLHLGWRVLMSPFVTTDTGTGLVHIAPAFGEMDYGLLEDEQFRFMDADKMQTEVREFVQPILLNPVAPDGTFTARVKDYEGRWVKDCDKDICRNLKQRGLLFHQDQYIHDYPFCWRADEDPLIQYPRKSWFIRTTQFKDRMVANNQQVNWLPEHIKAGRMGNFLETNVDWALSRERYWGTPLPIWVCSETGQKEAVANYEELLAKPGIEGTDVWEKAKKEKPTLPDDLRVHKPYIDSVTYNSPFADGARMSRVTEVIDCWYDSGAMPFAQWGYPQTNRDRFEDQFPAQFISEALDQTRGWFYSLMAISTMLFGDDEDSADAPHHEFPHPYQNCIVLGLMLGEDGQKMSKSKRNYREPNEIFDKFGADALRWYFFANQAPWTSIRYSERAIKESIPEFLLRLWNCYSFFVIYANIDGFDPSADASNKAKSQLCADDFEGAKGYRPASKRGELDRWILSELSRTIRTVVERMDAYDNFAACGALNAFVDALSNWYVRRSRDRFWGEDKDNAEKMDAYWTLYECLLSTTKLVAPFTPFLAETLWQNLTSGFDGRALESVHLCDYPEASAGLVDAELSARMALLREIASLGRSARMEAKLKVRQPLAQVLVILSGTTHQPWLQEHDQLLCQELNVKQIEYTTDAEQYISYQVVPNFKQLGPRVGKLMPAVKKALADADGGKLLVELKSNSKIVLDVGQPVELDSEDIEIRLQAKEGWAAAQGSGCVVVLSTDLTPELIREGYARDLVRLIQDRRKQLDCQFTDRIEVGVVTDSQELKTAIEENNNYVITETLSILVSFDPLADAESVDHEVSEFKLTLYVKVAKNGDAAK